MLQAKIETILVSQQPSQQSRVALAESATTNVRALGNAQNDVFSSHWAMTVQFINNVDHLSGLKKTRGGIGSAKFDARQRPVTAFYSPATKKRKANDDDDDDVLRPAST